MRLDRGTLVILVVAALVIVAAMVFVPLTREDAPIEAPNTETVSLPVFEGVDSESITRLVVLNNTDGALMVLDRDGEEWAITQATHSTERETDQGIAIGRINEVLSLQAVDSFEGDVLADFGLTTPQYIISVAVDETWHTLYVGGLNPGGTRYYALLTEDVPVLPATNGEEDLVYEPVTLDEGQPIYLVANTIINSLTGMITNPPYVPAPTPTPLPTATLNPMSEVEQATATHEAYALETQIYLELEAASTATPAAESTEEAE